MTPYPGLRKYRVVLAKRIREANKVLRRCWPDRSRDAYDVCYACFLREDGRVILDRFDVDAMRLVFGPTSWLLGLFDKDGIEYIVVQWHNGVTWYDATPRADNPYWSVKQVRSYIPPHSLEKVISELT